MLRKNVAGQFVYLAAVNATTGAALSGATISMRRSLDGTFAAGGATITEDTGLGFYKVALTQADTNGNDIGYFFTATNMVPICLTALTTAADPSDSVRLGLTALPNAAAGANTGLPVVGTQVPNATAGAANGLLIAGSNAATTFATLTSTGAFSINGVSNVAQTGDSYARIGAPAGASIAVDIASIKTDTGTTIPATLATIAAYLDTEIAAILLAVGTNGVVLSTATQQSIADTILGRNISGGSSAGRTVKQALHFIRNKWVVAAGTLTVYDTDDSTTSWTSAVTGTAGADPITGTDPT